ALAILTVILFFTSPNRSYWNAPLDVLGKLYSNNPMVILNRRMRISDGVIPTMSSSRVFSLSFEPCRSDQTLP
ncbi:hypothetical protein PQX77_020399, partial [Marasmius sp. AFHP31]